MGTAQRFASLRSHEERLGLCESIIGYVFDKKLFGIEALQTSGHLILWKSQLHRVEKNDKLAVLGDTIAKSMLCQAWYKTGRAKGDWTTIEQALLSNSNLARIGTHVGLERCIILNDGTPTVSSKTMACTMEAILGAVYLDSGDSGLQQVLTTLGFTHKFLDLTGRNGLWNHVEPDSGITVPGELLLYAMYG